MIFKGKMFRTLARSSYRLQSSLQLLSTAAPSSETATATVISKESMLKLRKRTGYSFVNCRKALVKFGEENLDAAEKYLREMAVKEGWEKAVKVGGRQTKQGQCGVAAADNLAAVVELMCETDFVANSAPFKQLVADLTNGLLSHARANRSLIRGTSASADESVVEIDPKTLRSASGKSAEEAIALVIGQLGENITFKRAHLLVSHANVSVLGFTHPIEAINGVGVGRFVAAIGIRKRKDGSGFPMDKLAYQLCQHIIGMSPTSLGQDAAESAVKSAEPTTDADETDPSAKAEDDDINAFTDVQSTKMNEGEKRLLQQSFMLNPRQTVSEYLDVHGFEILDFWRIELDKSVEEESV